MDPTFAVITSYFNPCKYRRIRQNFNTFVSHIQSHGVPVRSIELAFDDDPYEIADATYRVRGTRQRHQLWQKERLLNLLIDRTDADYLAWIDADVLFLNSNWVDATLDALRDRQVVQLFRHAHTLFPNGQTSYTRPSMAHRFVEGHSDFGDAKKAHPGYAWAGHGEWLRRHSLFDRSIVGGGDLLMIPGFANCDLQMYRYLSEPLNTNARSWARTVNEHIGGSLGVINGSILHMYHGSRQNRRYTPRYRAIKHHQFDPRTDLELDQSGLWRWTDHAAITKSTMVRNVGEYFNGRKEDDTPA